MKRTFRKLLALAMLSVLLMVSAFAVYAEEATEEQIAAMQAAGFTDPAFAKALVESGVTPENYSAFTGTIDASNKGITSIAGINKLVSAERIDLTYNEIKDITPIMLEGDFYRGYIDLRYNPINNFPTNYHTRPYVFNFALAQSFSLETGRWFGSSYSFLNNGSDPNVKVDFDVTMDSEYWWNTADAAEFGVDEIMPYVVQTSPAGMAEWVYTFAGRDNPDSGFGTYTIKGSGYTQVRVPFEQFAYHCPWDGTVGSRQANSPEFRYAINVDAYTKVKENVTAEFLGGLKLVKKDSDGNVLAGAEYGLFTDEGCKQSAADSAVTDSDGVIVWDGLEVGKTYYVKELKAPAGYLLDETPVEVKITGSASASDGAFDGGYSSIENVCSGDIEVAPDWSSEERASIIPGAPSYQKEQDLKVVSGTVSESVTAEEEGVDAFIKNGGEKINSFKSEGMSADGATVLSSDLTLKLYSGDKGTSVSSPAEARTKINELIEGNSLTSKNDVIELSGTLTYQINEEKFDEVVITDKSLCVFLEPIANKKLVGRAIKEGEFGFEITKCDEEGNEVGVFSGVNGAAEAGEEYTIVNFVDENGDAAVLKFCKVGLYEFTLREVVTDREEGMVYDETDRAVSVVVTESGSKGLMAEVYVDGKLVATVYSADTTKADNTVLDAGTVELATIVNRCTERANPGTGVPTMFSLVEILTAAGLGIVLKKKFF